MDYDVQMWNSLVANLDALPEHSVIPHLLFTHLQKKIHRPIVNISMQGTLFLFNGHVLNLKGRREVRQIFEIFNTHKFEKLDRFFLVKKIYNAQLNKASIRRREVYNHNIVKLISRARGLAGRAFGESNPRVLWFPYDSASQTWGFYRLALD